MDTTIRYDLLKELHAFVMSIPKKQFDLDQVIEMPSDNPDVASVDQSLIGTENFSKCGAVACVMGWAALMPKFRAMGLAFDFKEESLTLKGRFVWYDRAAMALFGLREAEAEALFTSSGNSDWDEPAVDYNGVDYNGVDQRAVFDNRFKKFMTEQGQA